MISRLQLDVCNLSLGRRHLVNAYEVKAGIGVIAILCDPCLSALSVRYPGTTKRTLYKYIYVCLRILKLPTKIKIYYFN